MVREGGALAAVVRPARASQFFDLQTMNAFELAFLGGDDRGGDCLSMGSDQQVVTPIGFLEASNAERTMPYVASAGTSNGRTSISLSSSSTASIKRLEPLLAHP
jgi:hypothetical protein